MKKIAITGGIGVGKSFVSKIFNLEHGIPIFNTDKESRDILNRDFDVKISVAQAFGKDMYKGKINGFIYGDEIDAKKLADVVFNSPEKNEQLVDILKGPVTRSFFDMYYEEKYIKKTAPFILSENAILIESGGHRLIDEVLIIDAPLELRAQRVKDHRGISREEFNRRVLVQKDTNSIMINLEFANIPYEVIHNDGEGDLYEKVEKYYKRKLNMV